MSDKKRSSVGKVFAVVFPLIILIVAGALYLNRQRVIDEIAFLQYKPTAEIASFAEKSSMNAEGKFLFYSAQPSLEDKDAFNKSCPSYSDSMAILGCYDGQKIYIYNITNSQLDGIREETAAYEMLHAAYKRLSTSDRANLDTLIEAEYKKQMTEDTEASVSYFAKYEPGERDDELFSVIATQFKTISPELETYYARYFNDRQVLVSLYNQYSGVFTNLENQSKQLQSDLNTLNATIQSDKAQYDKDNTQLTADISNFNDKAQNGGFSSVSQYNSARATLENRIAALKKESETINNEVSTYNDKVTQYNALSTQVQQLNSAIDSSSTVAPAPSL